MTDRPTWQAQWHVLAEKELRGAPLASLTPARHDGLRVEPALGPDAVREQGLGDAPAARRALIVTARPRDLALAVDGVWWRSLEAPPPGAAVVLHERPGDPITIEASVDGTSWQSVVALTDVHESGGSAVTEVAVGVAAAIEIARRRGGPPAEIRLAVAVGPEVFVEIAKLRALRRLLRRTLRTLGVESATWIAARTSERARARLDAPTNVVRATLGVAAAMLGGADVVGALPMDESATERSARVARNTPLILARESHLAAVDDPARGSFEIEDLTDRIARDAWELVREIEREGGIVAARSRVRGWIDRDAAARRAAIASRKLPIVGVSKHPRAGEPAPDGDASPARDAAPFERARAGAPVAVELVVVGAREAVEARVAFVRELLSVGGFEDVPAGRGRLVVVCAPDSAFETEVPRVLGALAERNVPAFVAGKPGRYEAALRAAGARGFVALGDDVLGFFAALRGAA